MKRNKENHWTDKVIGSLVTDGVIDGAEAEAYRFGIEMLILKAVHVTVLHTDCFDNGKSTRIYGYIWRTLCFQKKYWRVPCKHQVGLLFSFLVRL